MQVLREEFFEAVRRGCKKLDLASEEEIAAYFGSIDTATVLGHSNHIRGILFEQEYVEALELSGIGASLFDPHFPSNSLISLSSS